MGGEEKKKKGWQPDCLICVYSNKKKISKLPSKPQDLYYIKVSYQKVQLLHH